MQIEDELLKLYNHDVKFAFIPSFPNYFATSVGDVFSYYNQTPYKLKKYGNKYHSVKIGGESVEVQRLVAEAFFGPQPAKANVVRHLDGNPQNNNVENLMYGTHKENAQDRIRLGTGIGVNHYKATLTPELVLNIVDLCEKEYTNAQIAKELNITQNQVRQVRNGESWKHVTTGLNITPNGSKRSKVMNARVVSEIRQAIENGLSPAEIKSKYGISKSVLSKIRKRRTYSQQPMTEDEVVAKIENSEQCKTKKVEGVEYYYVTSSGKVFSYSKDKLKECSQTTDASGYKRVNLRINNVTVPTKVHKLIASHFLPQPPSPDCIVRHGPNGRHDNSVQNLEYGSYRDNAIDTVKHGMATKLRPETVLEIRKDFRSGCRVMDLVSKYKLTKNNVVDIVYNRTWKWLNEQI